MIDLLLSAWSKTVRRRQSDPAVTESATGRTVTFGELDAHANAWLTAHTDDPATLQGRAVIFSMANTIEWLVMFLALLKAHAVIVPLDPAEPVASQRRIADSLRAEFWWHGNKLTMLPGARRVPDRTTRLIKLTSGTTGTPRPLRFTAAQLIADASQVTSTMGITARDLNYALIPFGHSYGLGNLTLPLITKGVPLVCGASPLPHAIATDFEKWKPTVFPSVPAMWRALAGSEVTLPNLRLGISAGAPLPPIVAQDFQARFGLKLHSFYGSSETGGIAYDRSGRATLDGGVGRALRGVTLQAGSGSRLKVSSPAVFTQGNRNRSRNEGAWIMTDRVALSSRGEVTLLGRRGQTVKITGRRVNLAEVSARLRQINGVLDVWVGITGGNDPVLAAVVATSLSNNDLRTTLHADTATWKIPKRIITVPALPLTARGKTDTRTLQGMLT